MNAISESHRNCLACPVCHAPLAGAIATAEDSVACPACQATYALRDGIPLMTQLVDTDDQQEMKHLIDVLHSMPPDRFLSSADRYRLPNRGYSHGRAMTEEKALRFGFEHIPNLGELRILDLSCGTGREAYHLLSKGARDIVLLDLSFEAVAYSRAHLPQDFPDVTLSFIVGNSLYLPFVDDAFDLVVIYGAIHHYHELRQSIHELARVARAACAMSEPALMGLLQHPINLLGWNTEYGGIQTARLSESQLNPLFQEVGMDVVYDRQFQYFPPAFERAGNWKPFVQGWFFFLKLLDRMLPSSWAHSISFYAAKNKP